MNVVAPSAWTAYVDYLRLSHRPTNRGQNVREEYHHAVIRAGRSTGNRETAMERWSWRGYTGYRLGGCSWGEGIQGYILQASGSEAAEVFDYKCAHTNVPRIDIQATFWYPSWYRGVAQGSAVLAVRNRVGKPGKPYKVRLIDGFGDGDTLYVGARGKRSKFLRLYDKWLESNKDEMWLNAWRYEAELSDNHAVEAYNTIQDIEQSEQSVAYVLAGYYKERGIDLPVRLEAGLWPASKFQKRDTDDERRLKWLEEQIRPTIDKMMARGVSYDAIRQALGLSEINIGGE